MTKIFLKQGTTEGLLICKANLGYACHIIEVVSVLKRYRQFVRVIRCPMSNIGGEVVEIMIAISAGRYVE